MRRAWVLLLTAFLWSGLAGPALALEVGEKPPTSPFPARPTNPSA